MSQLWLKQAPQLLTPCARRSVLQLAALLSVSLCRDPRRLISRAPDLSLLALSWRTMAPFLCPEALWSGVCPLLLTTPDVVPLFVSSSSSSSSFRLCRVLTGSSVWQCQRSFAGCEVDDREDSPMTDERKLHLKLRKLGSTGTRVNKYMWELKIAQYFLFPPVTCMCGPFLSCTSPSVHPPPAPPKLHAFPVRIHEPWTGARLCLYSIDKNVQGILNAALNAHSAGLGLPWQQRTLWHVSLKVRIQLHGL